MTAHMLASYSWRSVKINLFKSCLDSGPVWDHLKLVTERYLNVHAVGEVAVQYLHSCRPEV